MVGEQAYETRADQFMGGRRRMWTLECRRKNGDLVRYNLFTGEFGVLSHGGVIRTYFKPSPSVHRLRWNWQYFRAQC